ncbi:MAG: TRAP transporter substrate-binding protein [Clostridiales Family XIII bacterium]|jgi:TRAP-type C4-dicarboxylate transport system substrate-binding protein|nr:TRAP transporter substrate-binding protein [Clostridiales Family XIII bacterium]
MKKMKSMAGILAILVLVLTMMACNGNPDNKAGETDSGASGETSASEDQVFNWKASFGGTPGTFQSEGYVKLCEWIKEYTDGTVNIEYYPGGTLVTDPESVAALQENTVQIAHSAVTLMEPTIHSLGVLAVPGMIRPDRFFEYAYGLRDALNQETEPYGIKVLLPTPTGYVCFPSSTGIYKKPSDLNGENVRVAGKIVGDTVQAWGGNPVTIASNEMVTALERGTVKTAYVGDITLCDSWKLYEIVPYITETTIGEVISFACMSMEAWDQLSENQKNGVNKAVDEYARWIEEAANAFRTEYEQKLVDNGNEIYALTDAEGKAFVDPALEIGIPSAIESGGENAEKLADLCEKLRDYADNNPYEPGKIPSFDWLK